MSDQTPGPAGLAMAEPGDVLRIRGELAEAQAAYDRAITFGHDPQPGLTLLWLALGRVEAAVAAIWRQLSEVGDPVHRWQLPPAGVDVLLAADQRDEGTALAEEMRTIAGSFGCPSVQGPGRPRRRFGRSRAWRSGCCCAAAPPSSRRLGQARRQV
jgi:hypothetical protein